MLARAIGLTLAPAILLAVAPACANHSERSLRLGGEPMELVAARGSLWVLTCNRYCGGEARQALGRIVQVDPRSTRVVASIALGRPGAIAVGGNAVYATDFWRDTIRRIDLRTRAVRALKLRPPTWFRHPFARDPGFLPIAVAVGRNAVWVATDRGALAQADLRATRAVTRVRLAFDGFGGGLGVAPRRVWVSEGLVGLTQV